MCSKKCAKPVRPASYSSREPVRTTVQYAASPSLGIGTTIAVRPFGSVRVSVGNGMIGVTAEISWLAEGTVAHAAVSAAAQKASRPVRWHGLRRVIERFYGAAWARRDGQLAGDAGPAVLDVERGEHVRGRIGARDVVDGNEVGVQLLAPDGDAHVAACVAASEVHVRVFRLPEIERGLRSPLRAADRARD